MQSTLTIQSLIWVILAAVVGSFALYRKYVSRTEIDVLHLRDGEARLVSEQEGLAHRLGDIDRWGKILTIVLIAYGVLVAGQYLFIAWRESNQPPV